MQITEQIIERIARKVFNTMFSPALRQSNVVMGGSGSSVSWADNAGHASVADEATTAGHATTADSASTAGSATSAGNADTVDNLHAIDMFRKIANSKDIDFADGNNKNGIIYINKDGDGGTTTGFWGDYGSVLNINSSAANWQLGVGSDGAFKFRHRWWSGDGNNWSGWLNMMTSNNCSVSKSGSTLTVKINDTEESLTDTNTWRPVVNNLSSTDTTSSLSAAMGKDLYDYITTLQGYFDANGNAKSALKLTTVSKTAWGKTFWTSGGVPTSISGDMTSVGDISFAESGKKIGGFLYFDTANDRIGVDVDTPLSTLHVGGAGRFAGNVFPAADYTTTEYNLGLSDKRWSRVYARFCELYGTAPACHVGTSSSARISLHWSSDSNRGLYDYTDAWIIGTDGTNTFLMGGNVGIGTTSPSYKLHVSGQIYSTGGFTFLSDERKKNIIDRDVKLSVADIANAPLIHYTLKDDPLRRVRIGSIAQYWQKVLPESVSTDKEGTLSMSYDLQAHTAVVVLARRVQELEKMINELQSRKA